MQSHKIPVVSIIICTYRRFDLLSNAVSSLIQQTADKNDYEIIIVDNDMIPNKEVRKIINDAEPEINITYLNEPRLGLSHSRNKGGKQANGKFIGFMDDDSQAHCNYISNFIEIQKENSFDICGGPYFAFYLSDKPKWFLDEYESVEIGPSRFLNNKEFLSGTNIIFRKNLLDELGWFNTELGMVGNNIAFGEETSLQIHAWNKNKNLRVYYSQELVVYHLVPIHKMSISDKLKRSFRTGYSQTYIWLNPVELKNEKKRAPYILFKILIYFIISEPINSLLRNKSIYKYWHNYVYEKWPKYFRIFGQEWRLIRDLTKKN